MEAGGYTTERWWTPNGWAWKQEKNRAQPWKWDEERFSGDSKPVIGVTWYEAGAVAAWLNAQLAAELPGGYVMRLPTEAEWEAAAAYGPLSAPHPPTPSPSEGRGGVASAAGVRVDRCTYPWGEAEPTPAHADFGKDWKIDSPAPVGGRAAGAAACGAQDMVGSVWEVTTITTDGLTPWRGGSWHSKAVSCSERDWNHPRVRDNDLNLDGFRVVVSR